MYNVCALCIVHVMAAVIFQRNGFNGFGSHFKYFVVSPLNLNLFIFVECNRFVLFTQSMDIASSHTNTRTSTLNKYLFNNSDSYSPIVYITYSVIFILIKRNNLLYLLISINSFIHFSVRAMGSYVYISFFFFFWIPLNWLLGVGSCYTISHKSYNKFFEREKKTDCTMSKLHHVTDAPGKFGVVCLCSNRFDCVLHNFHFFDVEINFSILIFHFSFQFIKIS